MKGSERLNHSERQAGVRARLVCSESNMYFGWAVTGYRIQFWNELQLLANVETRLFFLNLFTDSLFRDI